MKFHLTKFNKVVTVQYAIVLTLLLTATRMVLIRTIIPQQFHKLRVFVCRPLFKRHGARDALFLRQQIRSCGRSIILSSNCVAALLSAGTSVLTRGVLEPV